MRTALVTGGSRGIGLGIALELARDGWALALCGRRPEADGALARLKGAGAPEARYYRTDIGDAASRTGLLSAFKGDFPRLDALVNNAGIAPDERADILEAGEAGFEKLLRVNLQGPYFLTQQAARTMAVQEPDAEGLRGRVLFITSVSAVAASVERGDYCVGKAGLSMAAKLFAVRLASLDIPVWELQPGVIRTDMTAGVQGKYDTLIGGGLTLEKRWGEPRDVGRAAAALLRGDLPYATGAVVRLDGGMLVDRL